MIPFPTGEQQEGKGIQQHEFKFRSGVSVFRTFPSLCHFKTRHFLEAFWPKKQSVPISEGRGGGGETKRPLVGGGGGVTH